MAKNSSGKKKKRLGQALVRARIITPKQLKFAISEQRKIKSSGGERIGEILLKAGLVDEKTLTNFLEKYLGIPHTSLRIEQEVDPAAVRLIPEKMARSLHVIAIGFNNRNNKLKVAMGNPMDVIALDTLKLRTGHEIERYFSHASEIDAAIDRYYEEGAIMESVRDFVDNKAAERATEEINTSSRSISDLEEEAVKTPVIDFVNRLLSNAIRSRASDIHVEPREGALSIRYRIDGLLHESFPPPKEMQGAIITRIKLISEMNIAEQRLPQDGRLRFEYEGREVDVRTASTPTVYGEKIVMRLLDKKGLIVNMEDMGMSHRDVERFKSTLQQPYGMILVTGPTGSGKTTTLYSALNHVSTPDKNIVTIEDPIEYQIKGINQIQTKPQIGLTFASGLRAVLRQDPDIIMIGEIRDIETLENAVKASLTGHLVLSTIHTNDAPSVVIRLMHMGLEPYLIVSCVNLVIAQRLVRTICPNCKEKATIGAAMLDSLRKKTGVDLGSMSFYKGKGCDACNNTGYKGRIGLFEFLPISPKIKSVIKEGVSDSEVKKIALAEGMTDILRAGMDKVNSGATTLDEVLRVAILEKSGE